MSSGVLLDGPSSCTCNSKLAASLALDWSKHLPRFAFWPIKGRFHRCKISNLLCRLKKNFALCPAPMASEPFDWEGSHIVSVRQFSRTDLEYVRVETYAMRSRLTSAHQLPVVHNKVLAGPNRWPWNSESPARQNSSQCFLRAIYPHKLLFCRCHVPPGWPGASDQRGASKRCSVENQQSY